jgi:putative redox protein
VAAEEKAQGSRRNGVDLAVLNGAVEAIRNHPEAGAVTIRTRHRWDDGFAIDGYSQEIENAGEITARAFRFRIDWPPDLGGHDSGPSPGEAVLGALGGCVAMTYVTQATLGGIDLEELEVRIGGQVDLRGVFEVDSTRAGLSNVSVTVLVRSGADDAALAELGRTVTRISAVFDTLANPVPMHLAVRRLPDSTVDPVQDDANIRAAWQAAAPLWPAWHDTLEAEAQSAQ